MKMKCIPVILCILSFLLITLTGCSSAQDAGSASLSEPAAEQTAQPTPAPETPQEAGAPTLLYMGQGSLRIVTAEDKIIYIDPFSGDWYDLPADLILVTHGHPNHNQIDLIETQNDGCRIITHEEALQDGKHQSFDLGYVTVEAVEAGYKKTMT